jgi:hypothetical protein
MSSTHILFIALMGTWCTDSMWDRQLLAASSANLARGKSKSPPISAQAICVTLNITTLLYITLHLVT